MIVVDASAALAALLNAGPARHDLIDTEVASGLRRNVQAERLSAAAGWAALDTFRRLGLTRYPGSVLLDRVWDLRDNLSAYDACYVALAEFLGCDLLTADPRLSRAPGIGCAVTVVPG